MGGDLEAPATSSLLCEGQTGGLGFDLAGKTSEDPELKLVFVAVEVALGILAEAAFGLNSVRAARLSTS